nr:hypothetical protein [Tanacetum cinerariifolium]
MLFQERSIYFADADNILPGPDEAVKLVESISLTEAIHQEEERHLHETHASLIIESELNLKVKEVADTKDSDETEN